MSRPHLSLFWNEGMNFIIEHYETMLRSVGIVSNALQRCEVN